MFRVPGSSKPVFSKRLNPQGKLPKDSKTKGFSFDRTSYSSNSIIFPIFGGEKKWNKAPASIAIVTILTESYKFLLGKCYRWIKLHNQ